MLAKFFESSLTRMNIATSSPSMNTSAAVTLYLTKYLATPFKQLELYIKLLKELYRFTEDHHIDRGDVQRSLEFYSELLVKIIFCLDIRCAQFESRVKNFFHFFFLLVHADFRTYFRF